jgi:hypothetical protein
VKFPKWLRGQRGQKPGEKPAVTKAENLSNVRRQTDQALRQQSALKERQDESEKKNQPPGS